MRIASEVLKAICRFHNRTQICDLELEQTEKDKMSDA